MDDRSIEVAFNEMINNFVPQTFGTRAAVKLFDGFPIAMLGFGVATGSVVIGLCVYWLIVWFAVGSRAWDTSHVPKDYTLRDEIIRDRYGNNVYHVQQQEPNLINIRRPRWSGVGHAIAIVLCGLIIIFGIYASFQVMGYDPAILVGLGVVGMGLSWGLSELVTETKDGIRVHSQSLLMEGDNIISWATRHSGKVSYMGATRFKMEEINEDGDLLVHYMGYRQLLAGGFSRYETGGEKHVYRFKGKKKAVTEARSHVVLDILNSPKSNLNTKKKK